MDMEKYLVQVMLETSNKFNSTQVYSGLFGSFTQWSVQSLSSTCLCQSWVIHLTEFSRLWTITKFKNFVELCLKMKESFQESYFSLMQSISSFCQLNKQMKLKRIGKVKWNCSKQKWKKMLKFKQKWLSQVLESLI